MLGRRHRTTKRIVGEAGAAERRLLRAVPERMLGSPVSRVTGISRRKMGQLFRGSSFGSTYSRPSGPIAVTWVTYSPDFAQWK